MSQTVIPLQFEQYLQNKVSLGQPTDLNEIIFALIPELDLSQPIGRTVTLPPQGQWVHQQAVDQTGKSGSNAVVYSVVIPGSTAPFTFNAMFLRDKQVPNSCAMVVYKATETKETGMALTKSMLMQFDGAADAAHITMDAATWQIDYQARLNGMDEDHRLHGLDNYGHTAFIDGFAVTRHNVDQTKYLIAPGVVYLGGLRVQLAAQKVQTVSDKPITLWLDAYRDGTALSTHENLLQVTATNDAFTDYTDSEGRNHYVAELCHIKADGSVVDLRVSGKMNAELAALEARILRGKVGDPEYAFSATPKPWQVPARGDVDLSRDVDAILWQHAVDNGLVVSQALKEADPFQYAGKYGDGDGVSTFTPPDLHLGTFLRGAPEGVAQGETQGDAMREIEGGFGNVTYQGDGGKVSLITSGPFENRAVAGSATEPASISGLTGADGVYFKASKVVPVASEFRGKTLNLAAFIHRGHNGGTAA
ncbi:phage tail-collar fiber domain-containing protein [Grimontia hollisae]|uniref:phage tail-collar fiber domain-containing protein n=1 Tax=Grimontia hollisae TaxID=673 RepID=UPI00130375D8|nr:phage tail protein [Grimontia hollisae]